MATVPAKYSMPPGYTLVQSLFRSNDFLSNPIRFIAESMARFGGTYTASPGLKLKIILTQDPEFINYVLKVNHKNYHKSPLATEKAVQFFGNGLLFSNGDYWLKQRRLIQPAFHREKLQGLYGIMNRAVDDFLSTFPTGDEIDVYPLVHQLSFNILIRSLFDIRLSTEIINELSELFTDLQAFLMKDVNQPLRRVLYPLNGLKRFHLRKAKRLKQILAGIIAERRKDKNQYADLLDMLMNSRYEDTQEKMSDEQIIDEALIMIFAGHETTANALSWMLYLLAKNPQVLAELRQSFRDGAGTGLQADGVLTGRGGETIPANQSSIKQERQSGNDSYDEILMNPFLRSVISESIRLYPPAWMTERVALEDDRFGSVSYPKGTIIIPFFYGLHRDSNHWADAAEFRPDRFMKDEKLARSKSFFPFGAGPRMCIGNNFAMAEMMFFLRSFLQKFEISPTGQEPALRPLITLRPDKVVLKIETIANLQ